AQPARPDDTHLVVGEGFDGSVGGCALTYFEPMASWLHHGEDAGRPAQWRGVIAQAHMEHHLLQAQAARRGFEPLGESGEAACVNLDDGAQEEREPVAVESAARVAL